MANGEGGEVFRGMFEEIQGNYLWAVNDRLSEIWRLFDTLPSRISTDGPELRA